MNRHLSLIFPSHALKETYGRNPQIGGYLQKNFSSTATAELVSKKSWTEGKMHRRRVLSPSHPTDTVRQTGATMPLTLKMTSRPAEQIFWLIAEKRPHPENRKAKMQLGTKSQVRLTTDRRNTASPQKQEDETPPFSQVH